MYINMLLILLVSMMIGCSTKSPLEKALEATPEYADTLDDKFLPKDHNTAKAYSVKVLDYDFEYNERLHRHITRYVRVEFKDGKTETIYHGYSGNDLSGLELDEVIIDRRIIIYKFRGNWIHTH